LIKTAGRWSWKSKSAKECVTTHLPNQLAPKMDGAQARDLYPAAPAAGEPVRVGGRGGMHRSVRVSARGAPDRCRSWW
ncbi:hypothetical protein CLOP_g23903, partial [Closterium sp. NIES-67]